MISVADHNPQKHETTKPILRPIDFEEARRLSPWPDRIDGKAEWVPRKRVALQIQQEYDNGIYALLLARWRSFRDAHPRPGKDLGVAIEFFDVTRRLNNAEMAKNSSVYGRIDLQQSLLSLAGQLFAGDVVLMESWWRLWITEAAALMQAQWPFSEVVEIGCGSGVNLFNAYARLGLVGVAGIEMSERAIDFLQTIAADCGVTLRAKSGDASDTANLESLAPREKRWALLSVHAIEQLPKLSLSWFEALLALKNPPVLGMHFEPLHWGDSTPFANACKRYAALNGYNSDFLAVLDHAEKSGLIRIVNAEKQVIGHSPFNPTSFVSWAPK